MAVSNATVKYDVSNMTYDGNGNILTMYQYRLKASGSSAAIYQLHYTYKTGSNNLARVADLAASTDADHLGDFQDGTNSGDDYAYDGNGNMTSNQNKNITGISYNILNLPSVITVAGKRPLNITMTHLATSCRSVPQIIPPVPVPQSPPISMVPSNKMIHCSSLAHRKAG